MFNSITGNWIVPTATQHTKGQAEYSADWIGIGGGFAALPNLTSPHFDKATVNSAPAALKSSERINLVNSNNKVIRRALVAGPGQGRVQRRRLEERT